MFWHADTSETELLNRLRAGQPLAVQQWFKTYQSGILSWVKTKVSNDKDAEELTQEIFLNCLKHLPLFRGESKIMTWMQGIGRHEIADYYRKRYAKKAISYLPLSELVVGTKIDDAHETSEKVKHVFGQLSQESQELLLLKYIDNKKVKDIAAEIGRSVKAVESDLFRAREEFKRLYLLA
jgi:RNA polymerase sigma factor (sigma-70 family)